MAELTQGEKLQLYKEGRWQCPMPPVTPARWSDESWIRYIDKHGKWFPHQQEVPW